MAPLWVSSYVLQLRVPMVSLTVENIADFISAYLIGNLLQMAFRFWAFRRWVFPDEFGAQPGQGAGVRSPPAASPRCSRTTPRAPGNVTLLRAWRNRSGQPSGSAGPDSGLLGAQVSKTS